MAVLQAGDANGNREMTVQVLKSRMNAPGRKLHLLFNPAASVFYEVTPHMTPPVYSKAWQELTDEDPDNTFI